MEQWSKNTYRGSMINIWNMQIGIEIWDRAWEINVLYFVVRLVRRGNLFADLSRVVIEGSRGLGRRLERQDEGSSVDLNSSHKKICIIQSSLNAAGFPSYTLGFSINYLGVYVDSGRKLSFDITSVKQSFLLPVTVFMPRLRALMRRCIYRSKSATVFLF